MHHLRPFLVRHQVRFDHVLGFFYSEMVKPLNSLLQVVGSGWSRCSLSIAQRDAKFYEICMPKLGKDGFIFLFP